MRAGGLSFLHLRWNRGKRSIALDLRTPEGADVFLDLVRDAEVVLEGMRAGALAKRGLGYERLREVNPSLVFCGTSGFGQTGPLRDLPTHGVAYDAYGGLALPDRTPEGFPAIPDDYRDIGTQGGALYAALGVLAAVTRARATGEGACIDVAQADAAVTWSAYDLDIELTRRWNAELHGEPVSPPGPAGEARVTMREAVRYQYYDTADGRTIVFQASERHFFVTFCRAVGREDLLDGDLGAEFGEHAPAPATGAHSEEILRDLLGYDDARIAALREARIVE